MAISAKDNLLHIVENMTEREAEEVLYDSGPLSRQGHNIALLLPADHRCPLDIRIIRRGDTYHTELRLEGKHDWAEFTVDGEPSRVTDLRAAITEALSW